MVCILNYFERDIRAKWNMHSIIVRNSNRNSLIGGQNDHSGMNGHLLTPQVQAVPAAGFHLSVP